VDRHGRKIHPTTAQRLLGIGSQYRSGRLAGNSRHPVVLFFNFIANNYKYQVSNLYLVADQDTLFLGCEGFREATGISAKHGYFVSVLWLLPAWRRSL